MITVGDYAFAYSPSLIFSTNDQWVYGREPVLRRMPDGSLFCLIYSGGPREPDNQNVMLATRSTDDGRTWSTPEVLFRHDARAVWATEIFTEGDRPCIFVQTFDAASYYRELKTFRSFSDDAGKTWSEPTSLPCGLGSVSTRQGIVLANGDWLFPVYWQEVRSGWNFAALDEGFQVDDGWPFICGTLRTSDRGVTFSLHGNIRAEHNLWEPNVVEIAPDRLVMLMRAEGVPWKYRAESADGGRTWSAPQPTEIPDANSKITLLRYEDMVLMLHNPSETAGWDHRTTLSLWASHDGCRTWPTKIDLVQATQPGRVICYPHAFVERDHLYVAVDGVQAHFFFTVPLADIH